MSRHTGSSQDTPSGAAEDLADRTPDVPPEPGTEIANPAQPLAPTKVPGPADAASFITKVEAFSGYPKTKYHPVHGAITLNNPNEEAGLATPNDWFDTAGQADAARTWTEAAVVQANNTRAKLATLDDAGHPIVRNSVQAHEATRAGTPEPL